MIYAQSRTAAGTILWMKQSNSYKSDLLPQVFSWRTTAPADRPPPRTLISCGARDSVQTSTSPDEIRLWVQQTGRLGCRFYLRQREAVSFMVLICCRCVWERWKELQLVWIRPSRCRLAPSPEEGAHISKSQPSGPLVAPPLSYLFKRCISWRSKSCFWRDGVSKPLLSPDTPPIFRSEVTAESSVEALVNEATAETRVSGKGKEQREKWVDANSLEQRSMHLLR